MSTLVRLLACFASVAFLELHASAQEFRVYTRIFDIRSESAPGASRKSNEPVSRTITLFHAGKVYDYILAGDRMTIFEPAHDRFLILDGARQLRTEVTTAEIRTVIKTAEHKAQEYIDANQRKQDAAKIRMLEFQLGPDFAESVDETGSGLRLTGTGATYSVRCEVNQTEDRIKAYLDYADWAARLNFVVHPHAPLPAPRLALDESLRRRSWLPVEVTLQSRQKGGPHLRAEHRYDWKLNADDRKMISRWENELAHPELKEVSFDTYLQSSQNGPAQARR